MTLLAADRTKEQAILRVSYAYRLISRRHDKDFSWALVRRFKCEHRLVRELNAGSFNRANLSTNCSLLVIVVSLLLIVVSF